MKSSIHYITILYIYIYIYILIITGVQASGVITLIRQLYIYIYIYIYIWSVWIGLKNFVVNCHYEVESTWKWQDYRRKPSLFLPSFFFFVNALPLLFPLEKWLNPAHTGLCFASCDREALRRSPSITSEPLMLVGLQKYYLIIKNRCLSSP